jgi:hypothetical protein
MKWIVVFAGVAAAGPAFAQPVQPPPASSSPVDALLATAPVVTISNGKITAKIARIDAAQGFYNGTRFDQAGVVTSLTLNGREFYGPWFDARWKPSKLLIRSAVASCIPAKMITPWPVSGSVSRKP